jgi:hypothetical protein
MGEFGQDTPMSRASRPAALAALYVTFADAGSNFGANGGTATL